MPLKRAQQVQRRAVLGPGGHAGQAQTSAHRPQVRRVRRCACSRSCGVRRSHWGSAPRLGRDGTGSASTAGRSAAVGEGRAWRSLWRSASMSTTAVGLGWARARSSAPSPRMPTVEVAVTAPPGTALVEKAGQAAQGDWRRRRPALRWRNRRRTCGPSPRRPRRAHLDPGALPRAQAGDRGTGGQGGQAA